MSQAVKVAQPWNSRVLSTQELTEIAELASSLPGKWRYEPEVALRPTPEPWVWIHPSEHSFPLSIGFGKQDGLISVTLLHDSSSRLRPPTFHVTVRAAFVPLWERLGMLQERRERRRRRWRIFRAWCGFALLAAAMLISMWVTGEQLCRWSAPLRADTIKPQF